MSDADSKMLMKHQELLEKMSFKSDDKAIKEHIKVETHKVYRENKEYVDKNLFPQIKRLNEHI